ncbi:MAG TPA: Ig-like domain-containing protein [Micromonosporaceae bacterium]|nr:Ig-like domain-containing protein [Micromonosporaceae bacterium]
MAAHARRLVCRMLALILLAGGLTAVHLRTAPPARAQATAGTTPTLRLPIQRHADGAELEWTRYELSTGESFDSYQVHRSTTDGFTPSNATLLTTIRDVDTTWWRDHTARPGSTVYYKVVANGLTSNQQSVDLPAAGRTTKIVRPGPERGDAAYIVHNTGAGAPACSDEWNYGASTIMRVGPSATQWIHRPVLRFDLRDIPAGSSVVSAFMRLWYKPADTPTATMSVHRLLQPWEEGAGTGQCDGSGVTWRETERGVRWKSAGGAFDPAADATLGTKNRTDGGYDTFQLGNLVQEWVNGTPNHGVLVKQVVDSPPTTTTWFDYYSDDYADSGFRPYLEVQYTDGSTATGPRVALVSPDGATPVRGNVPLSAAAGDDRRVEKVQFFINGATTPVAEKTAPPWTGSWDSRTVSAGRHTVTARATDDVGQSKQVSRTIVVDNSTAPTNVAVTAPLSATVAGPVTVTATASDDIGVTQVEFYVDDHLIGTDLTAPYSAVWKTLDPLVTAYDGSSHQLKVRAYDGSGGVTTSTVRTVSTLNAAGTPYQASFDLNAPGTADDAISIPPKVLSNELAPTTDPYATDPASSTGLVATPRDSTIYVASTAGADAATADAADAVLQPVSRNGFKVDVTVRNNSQVSWNGGPNGLGLWYRWYLPNGVILFEGPGGSHLPQVVEPGQSAAIPVAVQPPPMPAGLDLAQVRLRFDLYDPASAAPNKWFAGRGNRPVDNPVIVNRDLGGALGLERFWQYEGDEAGAGMATQTNVANGNMLLRWSPFFAPGRGVSTMVDLTYNSLEDHSESPAGNNFSLSISGLTRLGHGLDIHPNHADTISGRSNKYVTFTDGDGTTHRLTGTTNGDGTTTWTEPPGVNLYLRTTTDPDANRRWALTRPDNVTFYFDPDGYPTAVVDRNGNTLTFVLADVDGGEDPGGPKRRVTAVTDAAGRSFTIDYYSRDEAKKAHVRGKIQRITDHSGSALDFGYYEDGNLRKLIQHGGSEANGEALADRSFVFTYATSNGAGPAIPDALLRADPDPRTPNQSTRIYSVRDPRRTETRYAYYGPSEGAHLRWKLKSRTNRLGHITNFSYDIVARRTTVNAPLARDTQYAYDTDGKVTSIVDPAERATGVEWTGDFKVSKVTEPTGRFTSYTYNHNGYLTTMTDQLGNRTELTYLNRTLDSRDTLGRWSLLASRSTPRGVATTGTAGDFQWRFEYDTAGNLRRVIDPDDFVTAYEWNLAGSTHPGTVSRTTDPNGGVTSFSHDPSGQPSRITDGMNRITQFGYDLDGQLIWLQDPNHTGDSGADVRAYRTYFDYDAFHRLGRQSAPRSTRFDRASVIWSSAEYDQNDNVVRQVDPHYGSTGDDAENGPVRTAQYDAMDQLTEQANPDTSVDPLGERARHTWDAAGRMTKLTPPKGVRSDVVDAFTSNLDYNELDQIVRQTDYDTSTSQVRRTHMCYDLAGDLRSVTSPRSALASVTCPGNGPATVGFTKVYEYDAAHRPVKERDPLGHETRHSYDANGNLVSTEQDIDTAVEPDRKTGTEVSYNERDLPVRTEELFDGSTGRELVTLIDYDGNRNQTRLISPRAFDDAAGGTTYTNFVTRYTYNKADELTRTDLPFDPRDGTERQYEHRAYDDNGNLSWVSLPVTSSDPTRVGDTARTRMTYWDPGWIRSSDKPADPRVVFDYAAQGLQTRRTPQLEGQSNVRDGHREMFWSYYDDGMLKERRDRDGNPSAYRYDANNNLTFALDASGVTGADDSPIQTEAVYTGFNKVGKVRHKKQAATTWTFTRYEYDSNDNVTVRLENGKEDNAGTQTAAPRRHELSYDAADWLTQQLDLSTDSACKDDQRVANTFWASGWERKREIYRADATCSADPATWKLRQVTTWDQLDNGKLKTLKTTAHKPDSSSEVTEQHDVGYFFNGTRYENGHRTSDSFILKRAAGSGSTCAGPTPCQAKFEYDARERLIYHQTRDGVEARYRLDQSEWLIGDTTVRAGNVTTETDENTVTNRRYRGNQLKELVVSGSTASYVHDTLGNVDCVVLGAGATSCPNGGTSLLVDYAYDVLDRMASQKKHANAGQATDTAEYTYDALDRLTREVETHEGTADDRTTDFTHQGLSNLVTEEKQSGGSNPKTKTFSYDAYGHRIAMTNKDNATGATETFTYAHDVHGSVSQLISEGGTVRASYGYDAYGGQDAGLTTGDLNDKNPLNPYRYTGKRLDSGSATTTGAADSVDMGARRYGVDTGRFLQQDMFFEAVGDLGLTLDPLTRNSYALAGGNPVSFVEVDGHIPTADGGGTAATVPNGYNPYPNYSSGVPRRGTSGGRQPSSALGTDIVSNLTSGAGEGYNEAGRRIMSDAVERSELLRAAAKQRQTTVSGRWWSPFRWYRQRRIGSQVRRLTERADRVVASGQRWARAFSKIGKTLGGVGAGITAADAAMDQWHADAHRSDLDTRDRVVRSGVQAVTTGGGSYLGSGLGGVLGGAVGMFVCGPACAVIGAVAGGAGGSLAGAEAGGWLGDELIDGRRATRTEMMLYGGGT